MRMLDLLHKKRDGFALSPHEIMDFMAAYMQGVIPDYQMSAMLMAIYFRGMNSEETVALTEALVQSGATLDFSEIGSVVDKHSTGGVGDKTTLVLLPLVAAAGVPIAKMSGRGLGHTGGTIDKLSCIPGFRTDLQEIQFRRQVRELGLAITGQTPQLTPADGKLYALRDVTATVDSIPLIASSVMSKKIASGAQNIILDVKMGSGAFMQELESARELALTMTTIGTSLGRKTVALITAMDQPLGFSVGNHIEVIEAIETLKGYGPQDLTELCLALGTEMLLASSGDVDHTEAKERLAAILKDGRALTMFRRFVEAQGGDPTVVDHPEIMGIPAEYKEVYATGNGYVGRLDARKVGQAAVLLGAGRESKGATIDLVAGITLNKKVGDYVTSGDLLAVLFCSEKKKLAPAAIHLEAAYSFSEEAVLTSPLIIDRIT